MDLAALSVRDSVASLFGQFSVVNRAIVVHAGKDDLGLGGNAESLKTGNAGEWEGGRSSQLRRVGTWERLSDERNYVRTTVTDVVTG